MAEPGHIEQAFISRQQKQAWPTKSSPPLPLDPQNLPQSGSPLVVPRRVEPYPCHAKETDSSRNSMVSPTLASFFYLENSCLSDPTSLSLITCNPFCLPALPKCHRKTQKSPMSCSGDTPVPGPCLRTQPSPHPLWDLCPPWFLLPSPL